MTTKPPQLTKENKKEFISNDDLYRRSTQYRFWSFTSTKLDDSRIISNKKGIKATKERLKKLLLESNDTETPPPEISFIRQHLSSNNDSDLNQLDDFPYVNKIEELQIVTYYARKCKDLANFFKLPSQARSTAIIYLYKFYIIHSVMEYHPQHIMLTCLYLSTKVENNFIKISDFVKPIPKATELNVLKNEYLIMETLKFSLTCHHPYNSLYGFFLDIQQLLPKLDFGRLGKNYDLARDLIQESLFVDVEFLYTPPQIALACLWLSDEVLVERYLMKKFKVKRKNNDGGSGNSKKNVVGGVALVEANLKKDKLKSEKRLLKKITNEILESVKEEVDEEEEEEEELEVDGDVDVDVDVEVVGDENKNDKNIITDVEEEEEKIKSMTPEEHYNKIMNLIKDCAKLIKNGGFNPSVEESKVISQKIQFCLEPLRFGKKLMKEHRNISDLVAKSGEKVSIKSEQDSQSLETPSIESTPNIGDKRPQEEQPTTDDVKRVKLE